MTALTQLTSERTGAVAARYENWRRSMPRGELLVCCLLLLALPFATAFGDIAADTKYELAVNPSGFLGGAVTLWNAQQFGVLLNQYVGYLIPMGPFFLLLKYAHVAGWIIQRLWMSAVLLTAFVGTMRLLDRLGIGTPRTRLVASLAFALSPIGLGMLGQTSGEFLPMALMPWIILPLADMRPWAVFVDEEGTGRRRRGGLRERPFWQPDARLRARAVARSAIAIGLCSGMNAASTLAVMLPAAIYILTRPGSRTRVRMLAWWLPASLLATASWSIPLVLLSKYGTSIVPYTESAQVTSTTTSLLNILRGTESWIGYEGANGQGRPLAYLLDVNAAAVVLTGLLAALGLAGLVQRGLRERRFLLWSLLCGTVIIALAYVSSLGNPLEGPLISLINGPAAPFRNLWKFDPMIRLPIAAGLAHALAIRWNVRRRVLMRLSAVIALAILVVPAFTTGVASAGSFSKIPGYWTSAADWLNTHADNQAVLVEPGATFAEYTWGTPEDDVLASLTNTDIVERNLNVVGSPGNERLLDAIDQDLAAGEGSAGLTETLARMGVKYLLVRNDLSTVQTQGTYNARYHQAIAESPGLSLVAQFGPKVGGGSADNAVTAFYSGYPAVQIYQVADAEAEAVIQPAADTVRVYGGPESLITLSNEGLIGNQPVLVNDDGAGQPVAGSVVTDSLRKITDNFGELRTNYSPTLTASEPTTSFLSTPDYNEPSWVPYEAVAQYAGIEDVTASTSASDIKAFAGQWATGHLPYAAFDGNSNTAWESGSYDSPLDSWIQATLDSSISLAAGSTIKVAFDDNTTIGPGVTQVTVSTAAGTVTDAVKITGKPQALAVPAGATDWLRITVTGLDNQSETPLFGTQVAITSVTIPGVSAARTIEAPQVSGADPTADVLAKAQPYQAGCMLTSKRWVCSPTLSNPSEEQYGFDEGFTLATPEKAELSGSALLLNALDIADYTFAGQPTVGASSTDTSDPQDQAWSAFDGNAATGWTASTADAHPRLEVNWGHQVTVSQINIKRPAGASGTAQVVITGSNGQTRGAVIAKSGVVTFKAMTTSSLTLTFSTDQAPVQVTDVNIPGVKPLVTPAKTLRLACGSGPRISVDGQTVATSVTGTYADLLDGRPVQYTACGKVALSAGSNQVTEPASDAFDVQDAALRQATAASPLGSAASSSDKPQTADVTSWTSSKRTVKVDASTRSYLEVNENYNAGWQAELGGKALTPVQLDGWKQAWVLPAGSSGIVTLAYKPSGLYKGALGAGLAGFLVCLLAALAVPRRGRPGPQLWTAGRRGPRGPGGPDGRPRGRGWRRWLTAVLVAVVLAVSGLLLGGYPGTIALPVLTAVFMLQVRGRRLTPGPALLGGLFFAAAVIGAIGQHMVYAGESGPIVTAAYNAAPQVICLIVLAVLAASLSQVAADQATADRAPGARSWGARAAAAQPTAERRE
jgi:arabinofuranan 3-O-arabinosyltransferase